MGWITWIAIYFTVWWVVLFAVLPVGVRRVEQPELGHEAGAPAQPHLKQKFIWTSVISALIVFLGWAVFGTGFVDWRGLMES